MPALYVLSKCLKDKAENKLLLSYCESYRKQRKQSQGAHSIRTENYTHLIYNTFS